MDFSNLECNAVIEYHNKEGVVIRKENYKFCLLRLFRNEFREIFLEVRGDKCKSTIKQQLRNLNIHKKFLKEGKATIKFMEDRMNIMISNAPPSQLFNFMKLITIKMINENEKVESIRDKLLSSKSSATEDVSPLTEKDVQKAKVKLNYPDRTPTSIVKTSKRFSTEKREVKAKKNCLMMMAQQDLEKEQKEIFEAVKSGLSIFFTGGAGTGKSHLLKSIISALPPEVTFVTASTGVAACQLGGMTLHQFAGLGTGDSSVEHCITLASRPNVRSVWKKCQHLIIDEISMVHGHFFEKLEHVARVIKNSNKPFGGIQLILCGDFFQLPPVSDKVVFCFETEVWDKCVMRCFELTKVHRQTDSVFINILQNIRMGKITEKIYDQLLATSSQNIEKNGILATRLCTHTADAVAINKSKLEELKGESKIYKAVDDPPSLTDLIDKHSSVSSLVVLKVGAQVMLMKNINIPKGLVNGARGVVLKFDSDDLPFIKFNSYTYKVQKEKFVTKLASGRILSRVQIPLNLAWAFSIHKSQGLTLDCVELSLSRVFEAGHAYVALSRVRSLDCLRVTDFDPRQVWANKEVLNYYKKFRKRIEISKMHKLSETSESTDRKPCICNRISSTSSFSSSGAYYCAECEKPCANANPSSHSRSDVKRVALSEPRLSNAKHYEDSEDSLDRYRSQCDVKKNKPRRERSLGLLECDNNEKKRCLENEYPRSIFLIIATEFCERFSFCGLRTILSLYLRNILLFHENKATVIYHVFIMMCYFVPVIGAILADSCLGRFRTILYFSIIYTIGNVVMCLAATPPVGLEPVTFTMIGLTLIATGTGGIKPCVAAFGGDQFKLPQQECLLKQFFAIFYFTINFGGFVGMILTPILRKAVTCFGDDTCYSLGFGFPAALMIVSLSLFIVGKPLYRIKFPKQNIIVRFTTCMMYAICTKIRTKDRDPNRHWLSYAEKKFDAKLISDMKNVLAILYLFFPLPIFWSLFDQQGSRWTFQASRMNGEVFGYQIMPDQIQVVNPAIVLLLIPLFNKGIYPCLTNCHILVSPLQRMVAGGFIAGLAFVCSGVLEYELEQTYPMLPSKGEAFVNFVNSLPCDLSTIDPRGDMQILVAGDMTTMKKIPVQNRTDLNVLITAPEICGDLGLTGTQLQLTIPVQEYEVRTVLIGLKNTAIEGYPSDLEDLKKTLSGKPKLRLSFMRSSDNPLREVTITVQNDLGFTDVYFVPPVPLGVSAYLELLPGKYNFYVKYSESLQMAFEGSLALELGGVYSLVMREFNDKIVFAKLYAMTPPNTIHMFWIIPQYVFLSVAEVMFAISGLEFSFTQAPKSMKTVTMAAWYFSVACGNLLVIIITQAQFFSNQADEFFLFAGLIFLDMFVFAWMSADYQTVSIESDDSSVTFVEPDENYPLLGLPSHEAVLP